MAVLVSPGVLTREIDFSLYAPALSTTILGIVGTATKGAVNVAELITNGAQLQETFGSAHPNHPAILTAQMYLKYGRQLRFVRVGANGDLLAADADLPSASAGGAAVQGSQNGPFTIAAAVNASILGSEIGPFNITRPTAAVVTSNPENFTINDPVAASVTGSVDETFDIHAVTTPTVLGTQGGDSFTVQAGVNDVIRLAMDGGAPSDITLTAGVGRTAAQICADINAVFPGVAAPDTGAVRLTSTTSGSTAEISIQAVANDAYTLLGFTVADTNGVDGTNLLRINVDGSGNQDITLTSGGARTAQQVVDDINLVLTGATASVSGGTKVRITSDTAGGSSSVQLVAISNSAYVTLGMTAQTYNGSAGSNKLRVIVDGGAPQDFTLTAGTRSAANIVADLAALTGATASVFSNAVRITTTSIEGLSSSIQIVAVTDSAHTALGLAAATTQGTAGNSKLLLAIDGGIDQLVNLTAGASRAPIDIVNEINAATDGLTAEVDSNKIRITSNGIGAAGSIQVKAQVNNAYTALGFSIATTNGADGNDVLLVSVNQGADQTVQLTAGSRTAQQIADDITAQLTGATAATFNSGTRVQITTTTTGTGAFIQVQAGSTADTVLGFDNAEHQGTAAGATSFSVVALTAGTWGNEISVKVLDDASYAGMKILQVLYKGVVVEVWKNLSKTPASERFYETIINGKSEYVSILDNPAQLSQPVNGTYSLAGGSDGLSGLADADYIGQDLNGTRTGLQLFADPTTMDLNLVMVPGVTSMAVHAAVASLAEARSDTFGIIDPEANLTPTQAVDFLKGQGAYAGSRVSLNSSYVAMYYPWIKLYDSTNATITTMPPSAAAIRAIAFNDVAAEVWTAPAGVNRGKITEAVGIERTLTNGERDYLYENRINPIANFPADGVVIWGQKTLQVAPTALDRVNVRRLLLYVRKIVATAVVPLIFEPNTPRLWRRFINLVTPTFRDIKQREGLNDFRVVCDETTNTPAVIDRSEFRARIFIKPTKAAEFIIVDFVLVNQSSTFNEFEQGV